MTIESAARRLFREFVKPEREKAVKLAAVLRAFLASHHFACGCHLCDDAREALRACGLSEKP